MADLPDLNAGLFVSTRSVGSRYCPCHARILYLGIRIKASKTTCRKKARAISPPSSNVTGYTTKFPLADRPAHAVTADGRTFVVKLADFSRQISHASEQAYRPTRRGLARGQDWLEEGGGPADIYWS